MDILSIKLMSEQLFENCFYLQLAPPKVRGSQNTEDKIRCQTCNKNKQAAWTEEISRHQLRDYDKPETKKNVLSHLL